MDENDWLACRKPPEMLKLLDDRGRLSNRKAHLFGVAVCRRIWHLLTDPRSREAVELTERFVDGETKSKVLEKAKQDAAAAKAAQTAELKAEAAKAEMYRSQYPGSLHFDYYWDPKKAKELGLQQIWRDDKFTYLRGHFQETPALYELKDGKGSLINFDYSNGLYTVPKELESGYLAIGKMRVDFHRTSHGNEDNN